jgi:hypothetical protein
VTDGQEPEKQIAPRQGREKCHRCGGLTKLAETLPKSLGTPTYEIYRCQGCGAFDWVAREEP